MYISFLEKISRIEIDIVSPIIHHDNKLYNTAIFKPPFPQSPIEFKEIYFAKLNKKSKKLLKIEKDIQTSKLQKKQKASLLQEIYIRLQKVHFLKATYDIEAQKIDKTMIISSKVDYNFYNNLFFGVDANDLKKEYYMNECKPKNINFTKQEVLELIDYSHSICPDIKFNFGDFPNFSHNKGVLNITNKKNYNLQNIISLFFHETTHFFRGYNGERNLGFRYRFESYNTLEEGIAIYNEYLYGNKITEYGKFNPYYNLCYKVLQKDISETEKKEEIYQILRCKGYNRKKSNLYYYRFYKYSSYGSKEFFLKDLIYWSAYKNVKKLITEENKNYEKIMSGHIGLPEIEQSVIGNKNNFDSKNYFNLMTKEIKKYIKHKNTNMKKIFINICEESLGIKTPKTYLKSYQDLYESHNIITYIYYIGEKVSTEGFIFLAAYHCKDKEDLIEKILKVYKTNNVLFINTFTEGLIALTNDVKKLAGENITKEYESFRDKSLQRKFLQDYNPDLGIKYISTSQDTVDLDTIESYLGYPYIVKPSSGIQSAGVAIIQSKEQGEAYMKEYDVFLQKFHDRGFINKSLVFEEFIDGDMFSTDYFVDKNGSVTMSPPVEVKIGTDIGIDDFMNYARSFRESKIGLISQNQLSDFIHGSIAALGIRNTFIHHEFKLSSKGKLKTIEINGRIGGYRLEMIQESLSFNWLSCILSGNPQLSLESNFTSFLIYPDKKGILKGFNEEIFSKIEKLASIYFINKLDSFIGKEVGLTSQGFTKVAIIKIKNSDSEQFEKDYKFIEESFKNLLIVK